MSRVIENSSFSLLLFQILQSKNQVCRDERDEIYPIRWISRTKWSMQKIRVASPVYKKSLKGITRRHWRSASRKTIFPSESTFSSQQLRLRSRDTRDLPWQKNGDRGGRREKRIKPTSRTSFSRDRKTDDKCVATRKCKWLLRALAATFTKLLVITFVRQPFKSPWNKKGDENKHAHAPANALNQSVGEASKVPYSALLLRPLQSLCRNEAGNARMRFSLSRTVYVPSTWNVPWHY